MTKTLLSIGLTNAVLAALLAVVVAVLARLFRSRPALIHGLWLLVLLKLISPPLLPLGLTWPTEEPSDPLVQEAASCPRVGHLHEELTSEDVASPVPEPSPLEVGPTSTEPDFWLDIGWPDLLVGLWLTGALGCWSVAGLRLLRLWRILKELPPASPEVQERIGRLAARLGLGRCPRAWLLPGVMPPMLLAFGRSPRLLLPEGLWRSLDETQRDTLILHELAHLRRGDHRVRWLELFVLGLYWWHPLAWWCSRALRNAEEQCCDAWVVWADPSTAPAYAATLVETVAYLSGGPTPLPAGASGAGPVRLIKRRLTMILRGRTPRCLSRASLALLLLLGLGLLPVVPTIAQPGPSGSATPKEPEAVKSSEATNKLVLTQKSCIACHQPNRAAPKKAESMDLHAEVVKLLGERAALQKRLSDTEKRLLDALRRFEKSQGSKPAVPDTRLEDVEKRLKRLLKEVESLRRELRPMKEGPGKTSGGEALYLNKRAFQIPVKWNSEKLAKEIRLYASSDAGRTWRLEARTRYPQAFLPFVAPADGSYCFSVWPIYADSAPDEKPDLQPTLTAIVDTTKPVIELSVGPSGSQRVITWSVEDENLDLSTLRVEFRGRGKSDWTALPVPPTAKGRYFLPREHQQGEVQVSVADKAGNKAICHSKVE